MPRPSCSCCRHQRARQLPRWHLQCSQAVGQSKKKILKKGQADARVLLSPCVYFHSPGAGVLGTKPKGCHPKGQDALWGCPQETLSQVISSQCHAGGTCSPLRGLRHGCHGWRIRLPKEEAGPPLARVRFRKPWGNSTGQCTPGSATTAPLSPRRGWVLPPRRFAQLHASPKQISKRGMFLLRPLGDAHGTSRDHARTRVVRDDLPIV